MLPLQPEQATFLLHFLLPQLQSEQAVTLKLIACVPPDQEGYRPDALSRSAFELAAHIAFTEIWFLDAVISKSFEETESPTDWVHTCRDVARWYAENLARCMPRLQTLSAEDLATPVNWLDLRNDPAVAYLNIAIRHTVHHRGQLSAYLRPMGMKVPAIYVESADQPFPPPEQNLHQEPPPAF